MDFIRKSTSKIFVYIVKSPEGYSAFQESKLVNFEDILKQPTASFLSICIFIIFNFLRYKREKCDINRCDTNRIHFFFIFLKVANQVHTTAILQLRALALSEL